MVYSQELIVFQIYIFGEWEGQTSDGWMEWWAMRRGCESEIGGSRPRTEMVGGDFFSRL